MNRKDEIIAIMRKHAQTLPARDMGSFYTGIVSTRYNLVATEIEKLFEVEDYDKKLLRVALVYAPKILPCKKCGYPVVRGYGGYDCDNCKEKQGGH